MITDGVHREFLLTLEQPMRHVAPSGVETYIVLDPEVFHPDPDPDGGSRVRVFPGTNLRTGEHVEIVASASGVRADGAPVEDVLLVGVVPILTPTTPGAIPPPPCDWEDPYADCTGGTGGGDTGDDDDGGGDGNAPTFDYFSPHPYLGLRQLRIDESHDSGKLGWSSKQEVHLTSDVGDSYAAPFPQLNTRRFDKAFWTNLDEWDDAAIPPGLIQDVQSRYNNVLTEVVPNAGINALWIRAADVNYADETYSFSTEGFASCSSIPLISGCGYSAAQDFPLVFLDPIFGTQRIVMSEDDWDVGRFSRRSGEDWVGDVRTYNFATGSQSDVTTKLDAANHAIVTDDRVFVRSGLRGINQTTVQNRVGATGLAVTAEDFRWDLSYDVVDPSEF